MHEVQLQPEGLQAALTAGETVVLLDVREDHEVAFVALPGVVHIPLGQLMGRAERELDPDAHVVCICHHGIRSMQATMFLKSRDFDHVQNLVGGMDLWSQRIDPALPRY
jgi:rhodanese-related sulfurtransferase